MQTKWVCPSGTQRFCKYDPDSSLELLTVTQVESFCEKRDSSRVESPFFSMWLELSPSHWHESRYHWYSQSVMNEETHQKYPFFRKGLNDFEAGWITCGCICTVRKKEWKDYCDFVDIEYEKLISYGVTRWLSLYPSWPRMLQMYPAWHSYFMSIDKPTIVLKHFLEILWANSVWHGRWQSGCRFCALDLR